MKTSLSTTNVSCYSNEQLNANVVQARPEKWPREDWTIDSSTKVRIDENEKIWYDVQTTAISQIVKECNTKTKEDLLMLI